MKRLLAPIPALILLFLLVSGKSFAQAGSDTAHPSDVHILATDIFIPNAFSPNGDGLNDRFAPVFTGQKRYSIASFKIFNRTGQEVYNAGTLTSGWDGTYAGNPASSATYTYYLQLFDDKGQPKVISGNVVLIR